MEEKLSFEELRNLARVLFSCIDLDCLVSEQNCIDGFENTKRSETSYDSLQCLLKVIIQLLSNRPLPF